MLKRIGREKQTGFTLIELLVVISIIGLLASIVLASLSVARKNAQFAKIQADAQAIETQVDLTRTTTLKVLTGNGCTACSFNTTQTMQSQAGALAANAVSWQKIGFSSPPLDPWGDPYTLDENELDLSQTDCRYDVVYSAGPNGIWEGFVSPTVPDVVIAGVGDDYAFGLSHNVCSP